VPRLLVIGRAQFWASIDVQASAARRRVVGRLDPRAPDFGVSAAKTLDYDEIILDQGCFTRLGDVPMALRRRARRVYVSDFEGRSPDQAAGPFRSPLPLLGHVFKRAVDIAVAGTLLVLAAPLLCVSALAIAVDSPGGVLFRQTRVGRDGQQFTMYKLRTMVTGSNDREHQQYVALLIEGRGHAHDGVFKIVADPRKTRVGRWLRRWSIDELPQLWNVFTGSMSLVGPRPALPREVELYTPVMLQRTRVKPGMTGLWQVSGRSRLSFDQMVALDLRYWKSWSMSLEIRILLRTPLVVFTGHGAA
jgi:lipopolysaccharide/colanic/teichoic acid biosynthesis glycosyltransferase